MRSLRTALAAVAIALLHLPAGAGEHGMDHKGTASAGALEISQARVRAHLPNRPTAGYLMIRNAGDAGDRLVAARSGAFETIELHESSMKDGVMSMAPIPAVDVPAGGMAVLEPGGKHLMMFGGKGLKEGGTAEVTLVFEGAGEVTLILPVLKQAGGHGHGGGHGDHGKATD